MVNGAAVIPAILKRLFKIDVADRMVSVETLVILTTMLLVLRFLVEFLGPWYGTLSVMMLVVPSLEAVNQTLVHYTMGLMQLSVVKKNDYFQVWAVLLVTLQYSVKVGRPYSRSMQTPLLDIMSSLWAASLLRMQTVLVLKIPLWLIWTLNAARIVSYFSSSDRADSINEESMWLVGDYMRYEHTLGGSALADSKEFTMKWCKYVVHGEHHVLKDLQQVQRQDEDAGIGVRLDPEAHEKLITLDKIWDVESGLLGATADRSNRLKDVCLSFALYKLLRRRFYNLPMHEDKARQKRKMRRLVFDYILDDAEKAFRIMATELSFLQDLFCSKRGAIFATGFPAWNLVLSLSLVAATGWVTDPAHLIPKQRMDTADQSISHGVFVTCVMVALIIFKELAEIYLYVFSGWTKVMLLCSYTAKHRQNRLVQKAIPMMLCFMFNEKGEDQVQQHNVLISYSVKRCIRYPLGMKMKACTKEAIFDSIKSLKNKEPERSLGSYFSNNAFGALDGSHLESDTHKILVWHIATSLCEINIDLQAAKELRPCFMRSRLLFVRRKWDHYITAATLSNYCAYLVRITLVPDSSLVAFKLLGHVQDEIISFVTRGTGKPSNNRRSMHDVFQSLMDATYTSHEDSLTWRGAVLAKELIKSFSEDREGLWKMLADFWTGFLLHLAASTRASKHKAHLTGRRELTTQLWALLSHAGCISRSRTDGVPSLDLQDQILGAVQNIE